MRSCAGVESAGGLPTKLVAFDADVLPCRGCNACSKTGRCVQRDEMDDIYAELDAADAIVVATPVFFATVPAVLKLIIDRCQPYWARRYVLGEPERSPKRPGAILVVGGGGDPFGTTCARHADQKRVRGPRGVGRDRLGVCRTGCRGGHERASGSARASRCARRAAGGPGTRSALGRATCGFDASAPLCAAKTAALARIAAPKKTSPESYSW